MAASSPNGVSMTQFKLALCQVKVSSNKDWNLAQTYKTIQDAAHKGAKLVVLPEMWNCPYSTDHFSNFAEDLSNINASPSFKMLSQLASSLKISIVGGSIPESCGGRLYNTCCVFGTDGKLIAKHRKLHLFDINIPGEISFKESDTFTAGDKPTIVDTEVGRIGIGICHDIRFAELSMLYASRGAHLLCYPGAFNISTGEALWELSQRARAADNQLFAATCSPARSSSGSYMIWGHSTLVGPFGEIIATTGHEETTIIADVNYSLSQQQRENLPLEKQRRTDIYKLVDMNEVNTGVS